MDEKAVYDARVTIRSDQEIKVPTVADFEVIVEEGIKNTILKQGGGLDPALVEVNADADRVDK